MESCDGEFTQFTIMEEREMSNLAANNFLSYLIELEEKLKKVNNAQKSNLLGYSNGGK